MAAREPPYRQGELHNMKLRTDLGLMVGLLALTQVALPAPARAQDLVKEALNGFPTQTVRLEFSSPE